MVLSSSDDFEDSTGYPFFWYGAFLLFRLKGRFVKFQNFMAPFKLVVQTRDHGKWSSQETNKSHRDAV